MFCALIFLKTVKEKMSKLSWFFLIEFGGFSCNIPSSGNVALKYQVAETKVIGGKSMLLQKINIF